jgi:hypothetical protein
MGTRFSMPSIDGRLELEEAARELARAWSHEGSWTAARERIRIASIAFARLSPKGAP